MLSSVEGTKRATCSLASHMLTSCFSVRVGVALSWLLWLIFYNFRNRVPRRFNHHKLDVFFGSPMQWYQFFSWTWEILPVNFTKFLYRWREFTDVKSSKFFRKSSIFSSIDPISWLLTVSPKNPISSGPNEHLSIESFNPAFLMQLKTSSMFCISSSVVWAATPMSWTYWAHLSVFAKGSGYNWTKLVNTESSGTEV